MERRTYSFGFMTIMMIFMYCLGLFMGVTVLARIINNQDSAPTGFKQNGFVADNGAAVLLWSVVDDKKIDGYVVIDTDDMSVIYTPKWQIINSSRYGEQHYCEFKVQKGVSYNLNLYSYRIKDGELILSKPVNLKFTN